MIVFDPFAGIVVPLRFGSEAISQPIQFFLGWMVLSWMTLMGRFGYVMIQEVVANAVHNWRGDHTH